MKAKVCFMNEIHRVSKVPETLEGFNQLVASIFQNKLPQLWSLQYVDSDGDNIILADSKDFEEFQKFGSSGATGSSVIKVFVVPVNNMDYSQIKPDVSQDEEYQIIGEPEKKIEPEPEVDEKSERSEEIESPKVMEEIESPKEIMKEEVEEKLQEVQAEEPKAIKEEEPKEVKEEESRSEASSEPVAEQQLEENIEERRIDPVIEQDIWRVIQEKIEEPKKKEKEEEVKEEEAVQNEVKEELSVSEILNNSARSVEFIGDKKVVVELDILEQLMGSALEKSLPKIVKKTTEELSKKEEVNAWSLENSRRGFVNRVVHYGITCNGCKALPIVGYRYKCTVCPDFDYCEECESTRDHPHDFIKMKKHIFSKKPYVPKKYVQNEVPKNEEDEIKLIKGPENDYFKCLKDKAEKLQKCFPKEEFEILLAYVNGAPDDMSLEELVENYKLK